MDTGQTCDGPGVSLTTTITVSFSSLGLRFSMEEGVVSITCLAGLCLFVALAGISLVLLASLYTLAKVSLVKALSSSILLAMFLLVSLSECEADCLAELVLAREETGDDLSLDTDAIWAFLAAKGLYLCVSGVEGEVTARLAFSMWTDKSERLGVVSLGVVSGEVGVTVADENAAVGEDKAVNRAGEGRLGDGVRGEAVVGVSPEVVEAGGRGDWSSTSWGKNRRRLRVVF